MRLISQRSEYRIEQIGLAKIQICSAIHIFCSRLLTNQKIFFAEVNQRFQNSASCKSFKDNILNYSKVCAIGYCLVSCLGVALVVKHLASIRYISLKPNGRTLLLYAVT